MKTPSLDDVIWAELLSLPAIKRLRRNERVIDAFAVHGWITHTSRRDEFTITDSGRSIAEKRLAEQWPSWREDLIAFSNLGLSPEDAGAWNLLRRAEANQIPRTLTHINRRTLNAWDRRHSKVSVGLPPQALAEAQITVDEVTRLRLPPASRLHMRDSQTVECDHLMAAFGEVVIPERAWLNITRIEALASRAIITVENKAAFVDFPAVPSASLLFLPGDNTTSLNQVRTRMPDQALIHFGDLDPKGVQIYKNLAAQCPAIRHFVPDYVEEYLITHAQKCETPWPNSDYSSLHRVLSTLVTNSLWLEHEALVLDHRFQAELSNMLTLHTTGNPPNPRGLT